ncbi:uncharacterized protein C2845_PM13G01120 [Panicum miliaceum]|uniref:Methyltransferase type 11 domain-containing protein n=1 Tax=Panicum miliaceum TaxID=4540 RepID=A0A3L6RJ41_PANMI|nr:uncharacterized protein C2845_PM13G01120 [Panicum miliaceum]
MEAADLLHGNGKPPRRRRWWQCSATAVTLLMFLLTNTVSIVVSSGAGPSLLLRRYRPATIRLWDGSAALLADLNATQAALGASCAELAGLRALVGTANELLRTLLDAMAARDGATDQQRELLTAGGGGDGWRRELAGELKLAATSSCDGCFDLRRRGREKARWARDDGALSYSIAAVLAARPNGTVRVGLDLGARAGGTFAARMLERGVTVVTAAVSAGAPLNSFIASRGLLSVHVSAAHRLPFFDRTLDIVHAAGGIGGGPAVPGVMLEFVLFDVYRVLRSGGLFWLDHFPCPRAHVNATLAPMLGRVGFKKLRWNTDRGGGEEPVVHLGAVGEANGIRNLWL